MIYLKPTISIITSKAIIHMLQRKKEIFQIKKKSTKPQDQAYVTYNKYIQNIKMHRD